MSAAVGPAVSKVGAALRDHGSRIDSHGGYWMVQCPVHEDRKASLSLAQGDAGAVLYCQAGCETSAILDVLKLGWADLFDEPRKAREQAPRRVVAEYKYTDEDGELLFVKVRYEPKDFRVKRPDGRGGWTYKLGGTRRVLYRLPDVLAAIRDRKTVFLVEGEKDADRLAGLGYTATCNFDGAAKAGYRPKWRPEYGDMLREADVVIVRDRDEAGEGHARAAYADLKAKAASVRVVQAAVTSKGADLSDHLNAGHSVSDLEPVEDSIDAGSAQADTHLPGIPEYPVDALTGPLREIVDAGLAAGLPAALVGGAALGALATVCGQADLAIYETWTVRPCLWVATDRPSGRREDAGDHAGTAHAAGPGRQDACQLYRRPPDVAGHAREGPRRPASRPDKADQRHHDRDGRPLARRRRRDGRRGRRRADRMAAEPVEVPARRRH